MRQTLIYIPHDWVVAAPVVWLVVGAAILGLILWRRGWGRESRGFLVAYLVTAVVLYVVLPQLEVIDYDPHHLERGAVPRGLAIRGYGLFMLLGIAAGLGLAVWRARQVNIDPERVISLALWAIVFGLIGARAFYVIQKWDDFAQLDLVPRVTAILDMTKGGLVVYGSLIGGAIGGGLYLWRQRLPVARLADIVAPGMLAGLALGRLGCLMNGCCFGGVCDNPYIGVEFPPGSPPYVRHLETGQLLGLHSEPGPPLDTAHGARPTRVVRAVQPGSIGDQHGIRPGTRIIVDVGDDRLLRAVKASGLADVAVITVITDDFHSFPIPIDQLPDRSLRIHPTQVYAAINAGLICAFLWFYFPYRRGDGEVFGLLLVLYPMTRFLLETIRNDEAGLFGTMLTISQWVSLLTLPVGFAVIIAARKRGIKASSGR